MPFGKGWNRWALPQDAMDVESMKLTMVRNSWSLPVFKELFMPGKLADMDYNDIMASKNRHTLEEVLIDKALFLYTMRRCAPNLRATKPDLMAMYGDLMLDTDIAALLKKCNMTPSSRLAEFFVTKIMLLTFAVRHMSKISARMESVMRHCRMCDETVKFCFMKRTSDAFPLRTDHEMTRGDILEFVFKGLMEEQASPGKGSDDSLVTVPSLADDVAMDVVIDEDAEGFPMPPSEHEEEQDKIPPPIWDDADKKVVDGALKSTPGQAILKAGDQRILIKLRQLGRDVSNPIKAISKYHEERQEKKRAEHKLKKEAKAATQGKQPKPNNAKAEQGTPHTEIKGTKPKNTKLKKSQRSRLPRCPWVAGPRTRTRSPETASTGLISARPMPLPEARKEYTSRARQARTPSTP